MSSLLLCSTPVRGHVTPLLAVAHHLGGRGHRVRFLTGERYRDAVTATGAAFVPLPDEADYDDSDMDAAFPRRAGRSGRSAIRYDLSEIFLAPAQAQVAAIDAAIAEEPVDAVLAESLFLGAGVLTTRPLRPAVVYLGITAVSLTSRDTAPFGFGLRPLAGPLGRARNAALTVVAQRLLFGALQRQWQRVVRETTGSRTEQFVMDWPALADAIVQFTVPGFEYPRTDLPATVRFAGPVSRAAASTVPVPSWWPELDSGRPVVHVTQGTVANRDWDELVAPAIGGLAGEDVLVVVSTGGRDAATLPGPLPPNVRVAPLLPYDRLLPRTAVMVTNGGYGGVHYAMEHGVPLVVAGRTEDKAEIGARVRWSGVGVDLRTNRPRPAAIADAVRTVLRDRRYRQASARIGREIAASPGPAAVEEVVAALTAPDVVAEARRQIREDGDEFRRARRSLLR